MKTIQYWQVSTEYDRSSTLVGNFDSETVALEVKGKDMYRSVYKQTLTIFDSVEDFENNTREKIRERALAKLTVEERNALGFK